MARKKAWAAFSLYVRTRDAIRTTGGIELCVCVTCPAVKKRRGAGAEGIQAGHWPQIAGRSNSVLFVEEGVHGQCWQCNEHFHGNRDAYDQFMLETYGQEVMDRLRLLKGQTVKYSIAEFNEIEDKYTAMAEALLAINLDS